MNCKITNTLIGMVWIINGLYCKVLNLVPRHEQIVARILDNNYSRELTTIIGFLEIGMAFWIWSGKAKRFNVIFQISIICFMNLLEFFLARDLLLWGKFNALFAFMFSIIIFINYLSFNSKTKKHAAL